jgi:hypothetical protein
MRRYLTGYTVPVLDDLPTDLLGYLRESVQERACDIDGALAPGTIDLACADVLDDFPHAADYLSSRVRAALLAELA